jgi:hypothetical protein
MDVLEFRLGAVFEGFYIDIREKESMGEDEGRIIGGTNSLALREDVYEGAWGGNGRDRFTACHEFGHFLMHRTVTMARTREDTDTFPNCEGTIHSFRFRTILTVAASSRPRWCRASRWRARQVSNLRHWDYQTPFYPLSYERTGLLASAFDVRSMLR